jgi:hypothetical protein
MGAAVSTLAEMENAREVSAACHERRDGRIVSAVVAVGAALLLATHGVPIVFHDLVVAPRLATAEAWIHGDLNLDGYPPTPVVA